ncbi:unnamed protein product [Closterium sp. NIES-53]
MASLRVLAFDHEGRPVQFDTWLDDLQLTAQALYDAIVARYSSPTTAALGRLLLPYLFPELSAFTTVEDLVSHLRASDARYCAAVPAEFLDRNPPPMDHFLSLNPTSLTVELLEQHLLAAETSALAVGVARGTSCPPFFEGCSPFPLAPSYASASAAADVSVAEDVGAASASAKRRRSKGKGGRGGGGGSGGGGVAAGVVVGAAVVVVAAVGLLAGVGALVAVVEAVVGVAAVEAVGLVAVGLVLGVSCLYVIHTGDRAGQTCGRLHTQHQFFSRLDDAWRAEFGDDVELPRRADLLKSWIAIFDLDFDGILSAMYALSVSAEGDCYQCVPPYPGIAAAALGASESGTLPVTTPAEAFHTFTLDSGASRCFFHDSTTLTPLHEPVPVRLSDPSGGPVVARSSIVLPCPAVPSGSLSSLHFPSFSTNLVSTAALQDAMVTTTTPGGQRVSICTCTRTGRHLATFTCRPGSSLYTLATEPSQVAASAQVSASGQVAASCSCRLLLHQTLLWHHRLGHPSLPRLRGMHSRLLISGLPRSLPPLLPSPAPPCLPCVEGRQRAAPHSSSFPPTTTPLRTLHMDVWDPARVIGQDRDRYFLLVVDDYTRYTTVFPLRSKGQVVDVLITWIRTVRLQLRKRFGQDLPVLRLHSDRGGEFPSNLLQDFYRGEGILQSFTLPESPQQNGIAERRIGLVMEPHVSLLETSPTLRWTGEVGDASVFRVWGSRAFVRHTSADKLSPCAIPCVFLGFVPGAPGWQFYHPTSRRVFPSQDVTFDKSVPFYCLFPYRSAPPPPPPLFLAPSPPSVDPLPPQGPSPSGAARGAASGGAEPGGEESEGAETGCAKPGGVETGGAEPRSAATWDGEPGGAEPDGVEPGGAASEGAESGGAEPQGATSSGDSAGTSPRLSPQQLRELFVWRTRLCSGASGAGGAGAVGAGSTGVAAGAGVTGGSATTGPGGARTRGTGATGTGGVEGTGAGDLTESGTTGAGGAGAGGAGVGGPGAGGAGVGGLGVGGARAGGAGAVEPGGPVRPRPYFVPLLQQSEPPLQPASPLPAPSPYTEQPSGLTERREPESRPVSPVRTARRVPRSRPPPEPGTHAMTLRPSCVPLRDPLLAPPESSLPAVPDPEFDRAHAASPTVSRLLATADTGPSFESTAASALVAELLDFAAAYRLDYASALVAESASASPPFVEGECALSMDVLEDKQEDFECLAAAVPRFASMLLAPEGDPDAPDIPTPRSYAEAITGPYSSQWQAAMDAKMASWKSTGTYVNEVPPPWANIVDGMWIFRVKRPPGSPTALKERYVARGFSQRQGADFFQTFSPTLKMSSLRVLLHVAAQRDYELHSLDISTAFLQGSLHEEIWLRRPPGFTRSTTLAALGFAPATADPSKFLCTDTSLPPLYVLVYVNGLVFVTPNTEALTLVKSELQKRHICTELGPSAFRLPVVLATTHPSVYQPLALSSTFERVLRQAWGSCLEDGVELSSPVTQTPPGLTTWLRSGRHRVTPSALELRWLTYLLADLGEQPRLPPVLYEDNKAMIALCQEHRTKHIALRYFLARELQQRGQLRLAYVATRANTADVFTKALPPGDHQRFVTVLGLLALLFLVWSCDHLFSPTLPMGSECLRFESQCVHFGHLSAGGCQRSTGDPRLILGKGYRLVFPGGYGRTDPLLNKPFYPNVSREEEVGGDGCDNVADAKWPAISGAKFWGDGQAEVLSIE